jgi:hypothetical protein
MTGAFCLVEDDRRLAAEAIMNELAASPDVA